RAELPNNSAPRRVLRDAERARWFGECSCEGRTGRAGRRCGSRRSGRTVDQQKENRAPFAEDAASCCSPQGIDRLLDLSDLCLDFLGFVLFRLVALLETRQRRFERFLRRFRFPTCHGCPPMKGGRAAGVRERISCRGLGSVVLRAGAEWLAPAVVR